MGQFTNPLELYKAQKARFEKMGRSVRAMHQELATAGLEDALQLTSGTLGPSVTRGAFARSRHDDGSINPAGRRRTLTARQMKGRGLGATGVPLLPINKQSGKLHGSFRLNRTASSTYELTQSDPGGGKYRLLVGGTKFMIDSGYQAELRQRWKVRNKAMIDTIRARQRL